MPIVAKAGSILNSAFQKRCDYVYDLCRVNRGCEPVNTFVAFKPRALAFCILKRGFDDFLARFGQTLRTVKIPAPLRVANTFQGFRSPPVLVDQAADFVLQPVRQHMIDPLNNSLFKYRPIGLKTDN